MKHAIIFVMLLLVSNVEVSSIQAPPLRLRLDLDYLYNELPVVSLLKLPSVDWDTLEMKSTSFFSYIKTCNSNRTSLPADPCLWDQFDQEVMFYTFFTKSYHRMTTHRHHGTQLFVVNFIPTTPKRGYSLQHWRSIDNDISTLTNSSTTSFILNRAFMISTHPDSTSVIKGVRAGCRNVLDVHHFRLTSHLAISDRNILLPGYDSRSCLKRNQVDLSAFNGKKKYFLFYAAIRENSVQESSNMDGDNREFSDLLLSYWRDYRGVKKKVSKVIASVPRLEWHDRVDNSEFCIILPRSGMVTTFVETMTSTTCHQTYTNPEGSMVKDISEFLSVGCIPVLFIASPAELPLHYFIDWSAIAIIVYQDILYNIEKMNSLIQHLSTLDTASYRDNMFSIRKLLDYNRFEWPSVYHLSLLQVAGQMSQGEENFTIL